MASQEISLENNSQAQEIFDKIFNEVIDLQIVEGFFSAVERKFFRLSDLTFDVKKAKDSLTTLKELQENGHEEDFFKSIVLLQDLILIWRNQLRKRDLNIETHQLRAFCDEFKKPFDSKVFLALAGFYSIQPHSLFIQSKYDFVVTRAYLKPTTSAFKELRVERRKIIRQLTEFRRIWEATNHTEFDSDDITKAITTFDEFIFEAKFVTDFEELANNQLFANLRDYKSQIGEIFYHPSITAASIECNISIGNIFAELLAHENEKLSKIVTSEHDFVSALHDTSPAAFKASNEILEQIRTDSETENLDEDASQIWDWLQMVCVKEKISTNENLLNSDEEIESFLPAKKRILRLFPIISKTDSDKTPLYEYLENSVALKSLETGVFFAADNPESQKNLFLATLKAVIWAEEIRTNELLTKEKFSDETVIEISFILEELQTLYEQLKAKIDEMGPEVFHNLLYVANQLLETRLKLERGIVRYSKNSLDSSLAYLTVPEENPQPAPVVENKNFLNSPFDINRWLFVTTLLVFLGSFGLYFTINDQTDKIKIEQDIESMDTRFLPGRENWTSAQRVHNTLYVIAKDSWKELDDVKQERILKRLLSQPTKNPLLAVIITDSEGEELGTASTEEIETWTQISKYSNKK